MARNTIDILLEFKLVELPSFLILMKLIFSLKHVRRVNKRNKHIVEQSIFSTEKERGNKKKDNIRQILTLRTRILTIESLRFYGSNPIKSIKTKILNFKPKNMQNKKWQQNIDVELLKYYFELMNRSQI